jgi:hypothetical protein
VDGVIVAGHLGEGFDGLDVDVEIAGVVFADVEVFKIGGLGHVSGVFGTGPEIEGGDRDIGDATVSAKRYRRLFSPYFCRFKPQKALPFSP